MPSDAVELEGDQVLLLKFAKQTLDLLNAFAHGTCKVSNCSAPIDQQIQRALWTRKRQGQHVPIGAALAWDKHFDAGNIQAIA